jgi:predicted glycogen debranching enzyme
VDLKKTVVLPYEKNAVLVYYKIVNRSETDATIRVFPLLSYRHFHYTINRKENPLGLNQNQTENSVELTFNNPPASVILKAVSGYFIKRPVWVEGIFYREEENRGEASRDESYQPGFFEFKVPKLTTSKFGISVGVSDDRQKVIRLLDEFGSDLSAIENFMIKEHSRRQSILTKFYNSHNQLQANDGLTWLLLAAEDFVVKGINDQRFIIAGYQWFGSWGRDTFISLPGLMLTKGKYKEAKGVILDFAKYYKQGLIPNLIDDKTGEPLYNTVDGTLWYIHSILQYLKYTGDFALAKDLWSTLTDIVENHKKGTMNDIRVDGDGLLAHGPQLTWMDTIVDGSPYTPRSGKAVEVQALWYNALCTLQMLADKFGERSSAENYSAMAEKAKKSFNTKFWNYQTNSLFDVIDDLGNADLSIRPNQVIMGALDFPILDKERLNLVTDFVRAELLTPVGLRTLSPKDSRYKGKYEGDRASRDRAYHSGSIWPWLTGPLTTAFLKAKGYDATSRDYALNAFIKPLISEELNRGGLGTLNEINDGDAPFLPRGCIAQAWSVAEPLRAYIEDVLLFRPKYEKEIVQLEVKLVSNDKLL